MKTLIFFILLFLMNTLVSAQNILEALQLKNDLIGEYIQGELMANDTIIDLRNGYYEEFHSFDGETNKTTVRNAAIFHNHDGSRTLGISITIWDFACLIHKTNFYEISKSKDRIHPVLNDDILPDLTIRAFLTDTILSILNKYLPELQENYPNANVTIDYALPEVYQIKYIQPQIGTSLIATLGVCDLIPISTTPEEWSIIENDFLSIELTYDKAQKKFKKR